MGFSERPRLGVGLPLTLQATSKCLAAAFQAAGLAALVVGEKDQ